MTSKLERAEVGLLICHYRQATRRNVMGWFSFFTRSITRSVSFAPKRASTPAAAAARQRYPLGLAPRYTHGPVVQTGPTAGHNRARNQDGQWRRKNTRGRV